MGWFDTLLDVSNLAIGVSNYAQLQRMKQQGESAAVIQAIIKALREEIFQLKQAANEILDTRYSSPLFPAVAMKMLNLRVKESKITPDLFPELVDKEYVAQTYRFIEKNVDSLCSGLTQDELFLVNQAVNKSFELSEYNFYVEHYDGGKVLDEAQKTYERLKGQNNPSSRSAKSCAIVLLWIMGAIAIPFMFNSTDQGAGAMENIVIFGGLILVIVYFVKNKGPNEFKKAEEVIKQYGDQIDLNRFRQLDHKFQSNIADIKQRQSETSHWLDCFFNCEFEEINGSARIIQQNRLVEVNPIVEPTSQSSLNLTQKDPIIDATALPSAETVTHKTNIADALPNPVEEEVGETQSDTNDQILKNNVEAPQQGATDEKKDTQKPVEQTLKAIYCMSCGYRLPQDAIYCPNCGAKLEM